MCYATEFAIIIEHADESANAIVGEAVREHLENYIVQKRRRRTQCNLREPWHLSLIHIYGEEPCEGSEDNLEPSKENERALKDA